MSRHLLIFTAAVVALAGARLLWAPGLLGHAGGEVWGHAWVQWWHGAALPGWPMGTDLAVGAASWPVIDPLPTLLTAGLGRIFGVVPAYDMWILACVGFAFLGGAALARREGGDPVVGGLALALAPALMGSLSSGLTEDGAVGLAALALSRVGDPGLRRGALTGVLLAALAACGLVLAWQASLVAVGFGLWSLRDRARAGALALAGAVAGLGALAVAWPLRDRLGGAGHRSGAAQEQAEALWRLNPWRGVDLLSLVTPGAQDPGEALVRVHPGYLGLVALGLALAAGRSRWWPVLVAAVLVAPGARLSLAGQPLGLDNPVVSLLHQLPGGALLNHHGRALLVGAVALSALASRGAARLAGRAPWVRPAIIGALAIDLALLSPWPLPLPTADASPPDVAYELGALSPGAVLVVPVAGPGVNPQRALLDQRAHGRPLLLSPNRPGLVGGLAKHPTARWLAGLAMPNPPAAPARFEAPPGVAVLLVLAPYVDAVTAAAGPPDVRGQDGAAWDLGRLATP